MSQPEKDPKYRLQDQFNMMTGLAGQIAGLTLLLVFGAVFGGLWLDRVFSTGHVILIILVLSAGPLSLYLTFKLAMRTVGKLKPPAAGGSKPRPEEDDTGEQ